MPTREPRCDQQPENVRCPYSGDYFVEGNRIMFADPRRVPSEMFLVESGGNSYPLTEAQHQAFLADRVLPPLALRREDIVLNRPLGE
jgi:hypothetical protein